MKKNNIIALDTNAFIAYRQGIDEVCNRIDNAEDILVSVVVIGELLFGALNSTQVEKNRAAIEKLTQNATVISVDKSMAEKYAEVRNTLKKAGSPIPENDMWIAASCLQLNVPLLTNDQHFDYVPGIKTIHW
ncbi:MAG: type II toxin-antitoxin system VapC family toxin [Ignavibacteriae bacterium]|nr:type II toxin-antitoxin system VapC family toxin [Ignavibacteriota bacterium]